MTTDIVDQRLYLTILLYLHNGQRPLFHDYERQVKPIIESHGGRFERMIQPTQVVGDLALPDEIHLLSFPSAQSFQDYRDDPGLATLTPRRKELVAKTIVISGRAQPVF